MSSSPPHHLETAIDFVERIGDEAARDIEGETGEGSPIIGKQCHHGEHRYLVLTGPDWEHVTLRYSFNGDEAWHVRTSTEIDPNNDHVDISQTEIQEARVQLQQELEGQPSGIKRELRLNLVELLSKQGCGLTLDTDGALNIHGFNIDRKCFVADDNFGIQDFSDAVQNIVNLGWVGGSLLIENYGLRPNTAGRV